MFTTLTFRAGYNSEIWLCSEQRWLQSDVARTTTVESTLTRAEQMDKVATTNDNSVCTTWRPLVTLHLALEKTSEIGLNDGSKQREKV